MTAQIGGSLDWAITYELLRFRWSNTPEYLRARLNRPDTDRPQEVSDDELRSLILFARSHWRGDPTNPRQIDAYRTMWLVPLNVGARLFADPPNNAPRDAA